MNLIDYTLPRLRGLQRAAVWFAAASILLATSGCSQKDIGLEASTPLPLHVMLMWELAPHAEVDGMSLYFLPLSEDFRFWRFDIAGMEGGEIEIPSGRYRLITLNNDLPGIRVSPGDGGDGFRIIARPAGDDADGKRLMPSGMIYGDVVDAVEVSPCGVTYSLPDDATKVCPHSLVRCHPDSLSTIYTVLMRPADDSPTPRSVHASLDGVATSLDPVEKVAYGPPGCLDFTLTPDSGRAAADGDPLRFTGTSSGLGTPEGEPRFTLTLSASMTDRKTYSKSFDVTAQVINSNTPHNVIIILDDISFPPQSTEDEDVGLSVGVDGWQQIEVFYDTSEM